MIIQSVWQKSFDFFAGKAIFVEPAETPLTSDAGLLPIRQFDERIGLTRRFIAALSDPRHPSYIDHTFAEMTRLRIYGILADSAVLFALAAAQQFIDGKGLYAVAGISGLTEMDAITLSTARMSNVVQTDPNNMNILHDGWRLIVLAAMANMVSKAFLAGVLGGRDLFKQILLLFSLPLAGGAAILLFFR
jgi:hypothetical protein